MDITVQTLKDQVKKAQQELAQVKKDLIKELADAKTRAKVEATKAVAKAYADGIKKAVQELEQTVQKQRKIAADATTAAEKASQKIAKPVEAKKKLTAVKSSASAAKKPADDSARAAQQQPNSSLHERRLGILEREFSPNKSAQGNRSEEQIHIRDFADLEDLMKKDDWS